MAAKKLPPKRTRNAAATREAILASARKAFVRSGYEGAGVREIAAGAGVTAMLVNRYFGSKEQLFAEVVTQTMSDPVILTAETLVSPKAENIAAALVELTKKGATPLDGFLIMHRSGSSARAAEIGREQIEKRYQKLLAPALGGENAEQRAAILVSIVAGFQIMRQMIGLSALSKADPKVLAKLLTPLIQSLIASNGSRAGAS
jgi:AcrR family transcriptional regulator